MDRARTAGRRIGSAIIRTAVVFMMLLPFSFTASGQQEDAPVSGKERTRGDFTFNINLSFPVFSSGPETFGYEAVGFGYTFLNNNLEAGINLGGLVTKGTLYTHSRMKGMVMGTAYLSLLFGNQTGTPSVLRLRPVWVTAPSIRSPSRPEPCSVSARHCFTVL